VQVNFGCDAEPEMIAMLAQVVRDAHSAGLPVLAMAYVRDNQGVVCTDAEQVLHAARAAQELGVDAVKIPMVGPDTITRARELLSIPTLVAGGAKSDEQQFLREAESSLRAGADGLCVGRNVFQSADPGALLSRLSRLSPLPVVPRVPEPAADGSRPQLRH
jgi:DhnA family fructose-bisphosphate aldolase class Ia